MGEAYNELSKASCDDEIVAQDLLFSELSPEIQITLLSCSILY